MQAAGELSETGLVERGELLARIAGSVGTEKVVDAMSDPSVRSLVNWLCEEASKTDGR